MKCITIIVFMLLLSTCLFGQDKKKPLVVASASMIADMASSIGSDHVKVKMIVPIGGDPHLHEPTPDNARLVAQADLVLINGLTFEGWIAELIENSGTKAKTITVTEGIDVLTSTTYKNSADPHAWMDASNGTIYANNIKNALIQIDPIHTVSYEANFQEYDQQIRELDNEITKLINTIPEEKRVLITSHDAFQYYGRAYGIKLEAIMGISTEAEAQTSDIIRVNKVIQEQDIPAIFIESTINPKLIQQLATDNNISIGGKLFADSLGDTESPASTYIDMLKYNTKTIVNALNSTSTVQTAESNSNKTFLWVLGGFMILGLALIIYRLNQ